MFADYTINDLKCKTKHHTRSFQFDHSVNVGQLACQGISTQIKLQLKLFSMTLQRNVYFKIIFDDEVRILCKKKLSIMIAKQNSKKLIVYYKQIVDRFGKFLFSPRWQFQEQINKYNTFYSQVSDTGNLKNSFHLVRLKSNFCTL